MPGDLPPYDLLNEASLFLDFDGTLVEIAQTPDAVRVDEQLISLMSRLSGKLEGRLVVITGRPAAQICRFFGTELAVVGSHGMEFVPADGRPRKVERPAALSTVSVSMNELAMRHAGVMVEEKPLGVALHFRLCPDAEKDCVKLATALAHDHDLHLQPGKMLVEVRAPGGDKGTAIRALMREPAMAGTRPVFMGDDLTDEPGFVAARELGGTGILVGERRASAARYRLDGVRTTLAWLEVAAAKAA